jgi:hypothetical protein
MHALPALAHLWHWLELASGLTKHRTFDNLQASHARFKACCSGGFLEFSGSGLFTGVSAV